MCFSHRAAITNREIFEAVMQRSLWKSFWPNEMVLDGPTEIITLVKNWICQRIGLEDWKVSEKHLVHQQSWLYTCFLAFYFVTQNKGKAFSSVHLVKLTCKMAGLSFLAERYQFFTLDYGLHVCVHIISHDIELIDSLAF